MPIHLLRWGLLSTARINRALIQPLRVSKRNTLSAVASRSLDAAKAYAREHNIPRYFGGYDEMLANPDIDVIYNSLPNHLHAEWTIRALDAGKHVLCEKPLALTVEQVDAIQAAARSNNRVVAEAFMYRHHPQTIKVKEMLDQGSVGQVLLVRGAFSYTLKRPDDIRLDSEKGGGSLWDVGCYPLSYTRYLLGTEPEEVSGRQRTGPAGVDDFFVAQARFPGDVFMQFDCGFCAPSRAFMEIIGTDGSLLVQDPFKPAQSISIRLRQGNDRPKTIRMPRFNLYLGEVEDMADAILHNTPPRISLADSRLNVAALCALYESARTGQPVRL